MDNVKHCWPTPWIEAAMRAGFAHHEGGGRWVFLNDKMRDMLAEFAEDVQAAERERWQKACGAIARDLRNHDMVRLGAAKCLDAGNRA